MNRLIESERNDLIESLVAKGVTREEAESICESPSSIMKYTNYVTMKRVLINEITPIPEPTKVPMVTAVVLVLLLAFFCGGASMVLLYRAIHGLL